MLRTVILAALAVLLAGTGVVRVVDLERRVVELDAATEAAPTDLQAVAAVLERTRHDLRDVRRMLTELEARESDAETGLRTQLTEVEDRLERTGAELAEWIAREEADAAALAELRESYGPDTLERRVREAQLALDERWDGLQVAVDEAIAIARETHGHLATLDRDVGAMWDDLLGPTVQLAGEATVGSGVLLVSEGDGSLADGAMLVLTAWHVVRDIRAETSDPDPDIPVTAYRKAGDSSFYTSKLLAHDAELDVALLRLACDERVGSGVKLASRERLASLSVFEPVYAVGCPLGNDPIPTRGEIASVEHHVDDNNYWMISAPTYIGNSGGGVFDARTHELLGIFSKIYTHGSLRPTVVPHMGLATPLSDIYAWMEGVGYGYLIPD